MVGFSSRKYLPAKTRHQNELTIVDNTDIIKSVLSFA